MKAGYYKLIDREGYLSSHPLNEGVLQLYGNILHVDVLGNAIRKKGLYPSALILLRNELQFFKYLGDTMPKSVQEKRTPKAGEVWTVFNAYGEQVFLNILGIKGPNGARHVLFAVNGSSLKHQLGMSKFCRQPASRLNGMNQYRTFSH